MISWRGSLGTAGSRFSCLLLLHKVEASRVCHEVKLVPAKTEQVAHGLAHTLRLLSLLLHLAESLVTAGKEIKLDAVVDRAKRVVTYMALYLVALASLSLTISASFVLIISL